MNSWHLHDQGNIFCARQNLINKSCKFESKVTPILAIEISRCSIYLCIPRESHLKESDFVAGNETLKMPSVEQRNISGCTDVTFASPISDFAALLESWKLSSTKIEKKKKTKQGNPAGPIGQISIDVGNTILIYCCHLCPAVDRQLTENSPKGQKSQRCLWLFFDKLKREKPMTPPPQINFFLGPLTTTRATEFNV